MRLVVGSKIRDAKLAIGGERRNLGEGNLEEKVNVVHLHVLPASKQHKTSTKSGTFPYFYGSRQGVQWQVTDGLEPRTLYYATLTPCC